MYDIYTDNMVTLEGKGLGEVEMDKGDISRDRKRLYFGW